MKLLFPLVIAAALVLAACGTGSTTTVISTPDPTTTTTTTETPAEWPIAYQQRWIQSCVEGGAPVSYCQCTLEYTQQNHSLDEIAQSTSAEQRDWVRDALNYCTTEGIDY